MEPAQKHSLYHKDAPIVSQTEACTIYRLDDENGDMLLTEYSLFPGVHLIYRDVHMEQYQYHSPVMDGLLEINYCREGRIESELNGQFYYLSSGDLSVGYPADTASYFPLHHYHGITILIDSDFTPECLPEGLQELYADPAQLREKFCQTQDCHIIRSTPQLAHILSELYTIPEHIKPGYLKLKILELLLFLRHVEAVPPALYPCSCTKTQVQLAKRVCAFLSSNISEHFTIDELSLRFHISPTQLKKSFRSVYGVSVYTYVRTLKMQSAAKMLETSDRTILDIAGEFGYNNGSKFAKAFRDVLGVGPRDYRLMAQKKTAPLE